MKNSLFDLEDRVIVVTGAAGVLAGGTARYLLSQGAKVVMLDLKQEVVDQIVADAKATISPKVSGYACNVLDRGILESVYEKVMAEHGRVDALVNGAGGNMAGAMVNPDQTIFDLQFDQYEKVLDLNLKGTLLPSIVFVKAMVQQKKGAIVPYAGAGQRQGDGVQVALEAPGLRGRWEFGFARCDDGRSDVHCLTAPDGFDAREAASRVELKTSRAGDVTRYDAFIPFAKSRGWSEKALEDGIRFNLVVNDNDGDGRDASIGIVPNASHDMDMSLAPVVRFGKQ